MNDEERLRHALRTALIRSSPEIPPDLLAVLRAEARRRVRPARNFRARGSLVSAWGFCAGLALAAAALALALRARLQEARPPVDSSALLAAGADSAALIGGLPRGR